MQEFTEGIFPSVKIPRPFASLAVRHMTTGADLGGGCRGCASPPVFCKKKKTIWFIGVAVEQETSAPPPRKNPGSAPGQTVVR